MRAGSVIPPLFERLPSGLFKPLGAPNSARYWPLICRLIEELWGAGGRAPGEDIPRVDVTHAIERHLIADDPWEDELGTPVGIRAANIFTTLADAGWLSARQRGVRWVVTLRPVVAQFHSILAEFAFAEPEFLGSKVRSIHLNLEAAATGASELYAEAALQAKRCLSHIANTGCRIQDAMDMLVASESARDFVKGFFEQYVEKLFIADYSELRTRDHPLQYRSAIVGRTLALRHDGLQRAALIEWYRTKRAKGDAVLAEYFYERDTEQLLRLQDVESHLERLDREIRTANQRAIAYIEYKLRVPRQFDRLIGKALTALAGLAEQHPALPAKNRVLHASEFGLAKPRQRSRTPGATRIARRQPTIEEMAMEALRRRQADNRMVNPLALAHYVSRHIAGTRRVHSDVLTIESIKDLCCYQRLLLIAARAECPPDLRKQDPHLNMLPRVQVTFLPDVMTRNRFMVHRAFLVEMRGKPA